MPIDEKIKERLYITGWHGTGTEHMSEWWLWREVMARAILDAGGRNKRHRLEIARWIKTQDFETVCEFVGIVPEVMRNEFERILRENKWAVAHHEAIQLRNFVVWED